MIISIYIWAFVISLLLELMKTSWKRKTEETNNWTNVSSFHSYSLEQKQHLGRLRLIHPTADRRAV